LINLAEYRATALEQLRTADLLRIVPRGRTSVLDVGARDGFFSKLLTEFFPCVTALDLEVPSFDHAGISKVAGDITRLDFADEAFDCVFCAEVLEHIPDLERACQELRRVARHELVIGVPFEQDIRVGRTKCLTCRRNNPPWGHVNSFDERRLAELFSGLRVVSKTFVGINRERTNFVSATLMDLAGNPWGTYDQEEGCIHCGAKLVSPDRGATWQRVCSRAATSLNRMQRWWARPHGNWIHLVLSKD
jgi:SAM-dependent methyltransferase